MKKILVIEDSPLAQTCAKKIIEATGFKVDIAGDGKQTLKLIKKNDYRFAFLDLGLPDIEGFELSKKMRTSGFKAPIVVLTANNDEKNRETAKSLEIDKIFAKPITSQMMEEIINDYRLTQ